MLTRLLFVSATRAIRVPLAGFALLLAFHAHSAAPAGQPAPGQLRKAARHGELIIKFREDAPDTEIQNALQDGALKIKRHVTTAPMAQRNAAGLTLAETSFNVPDAIARLQRHRAIEYVEPNYIYTRHAASNDPYVTSGHLWGLYGDLSSPANNFGSQAAEAWTAGHTGSTQVCVAVIDEGIDVAHPELKPNIWLNPFDPLDGKDNDGNGYIDDQHGWNFLAGNRTVFDSAGDEHGTHVAGTIGARGGNGFGLAGVNWNVTILTGKFLGADGGTTLDAVEAIDYFVDLKERHGLNLVAINASWGGGGYSRSLHDAILRAAKAGILFVAAAGNDALNNDNSANYPANYDTRKGTSSESAAAFDAVISVAAIDKSGALASFSNYGATMVDLGAPGVDILSTLPNLYLGYMNGTSMAAPHVTGAAALYASTHPGATVPELRAALLDSAIPTPSLSGKTVTGARLNLSAIINPEPQAPPAAPGSFLVARTAPQTISMTWLDQSDNEQGFEILRSTDGANFTRIATLPADTEQYSNSGLAPDTIYYYWVRAFNPAGYSPLSNRSHTKTHPLDPPAAPASLLVARTAPQTISMSWVDLSNNEDGFEVLRSTDGVNFSVIAHLPDNSEFFSNSNLAPETIYYYRVRAHNSGGYSALSNRSHTRTAAVAPPLAPGSFLVARTAPQTISMTWTDHSDNEDGFQVLRSTDGVNFSVIAHLPANSNSYADSGLAPSTIYYYCVRAYNAGGFSSLSNRSHTKTRP